MFVREFIFVNLEECENYHFFFRLSYTIFTQKRAHRYNNTIAIVEKKKKKKKKFLESADDFTDPMTNIFE